MIFLLRRYNEETKFPATLSFVLMHSSDSISVWWVREHETLSSREFCLFVISSYSKLYTLKVYWALFNGISHFITHWYFCYIILAMCHWWLWWTAARRRWRHMCRWWNRWLAAWLAWGLGTHQGKTYVRETCRLCLVYWIRSKKGNENENKAAQTWVVIIRVIVKKSSWKNLSADRLLTGYQHTTDS